MNSFVHPEIDWAALTPILIVLGSAVLGVLVEAFVPDRVRRTVQEVLAVLALGAALVSVAWRWTVVQIQGPASLVGGDVVEEAPAMVRDLVRSTVQVVLAVLALGAALVSVAWRWSVVQSQGPASLVGGAVVEDAPALMGQGIMLICAFVGILVIAERFAGEDSFAPTASAVPGSAYERLARRNNLVQTEAYPLVLFSMGGMLIFPAATDLLTLFIALEVLSLPLNVLSGLARRRRLLSQEASLKYFLLAAFSSAFFLMGVALLYGYSGSVHLSDVATAVPQMTGMDGVLLGGVLLVIIGLLFKVGAVPFHSWIPDVE